ncbi:MAG: cation:proton antiporter [Chromatiales bacterium]
MLMSTPLQVLMFVGMLLAAIVVEPLARALRLPFGAALVLVGYVGANALVMQGIDTGLRWDNFQPLILYVFIPLLVFEAAFKLDPGRLMRDLVPILILAMPVMLVAVAVIAAVAYVAIGHPAGFPWIAAWLTGALVASTDPAATVAMLRGRSGFERPALLLDGESLFNDALAIVLFATLLPLALMQSMASVSWIAVATDTALALFGGIAAGSIVGVLAGLMLHAFRHPVQQGVITVVSAYAGFVVTDNFLGWSGVMAVLACGIIQGWLYRRQAQTPDRQFVVELWDFIAYVAGSMLFLLAGVTITLVMFTEQWLAMLIGIAAVALSRAVSVFGGLSLLRLAPRVPPVALREQALVAWGGVRGTVTLALALSLPLELDYWFTIQSIAYGVVLFTLFVQTPAFGLLLRRLG